jgi:hypothetical protein
MKRLMALAILLMMLLSGCFNDEWKLTSSYFVKENDYFISMIGYKEKIGLKMDEPFVEKKENDVEWYFWGKDLANKEFELRGISKENEKTITLVDRVNTDETKSYDSTAMVNTSLTLPNSGVWKLEVLVGGKLVDEIVVEVEK